MLWDKLKANVILLTPIDSQTRHHHPVISLFPKIQKRISIKLIYDIGMLLPYDYKFIDYLTCTHK